MFVVQRKLGQSILINDNIKIDIVKIGENSIKLGIDAPKEVRIVRVDENEKDKAGR